MPDAAYEMDNEDATATRGTAKIQGKLTQKKSMNASATKTVDTHNRASEDHYENVTAIQEVLELAR